MEWVEEDQGGYCAGERDLLMVMTGEVGVRVRVKEKEISRVLSLRMRVRVRCHAELEMETPGRESLILGRDQPLHLGIFRSDYLLHATDPAGPLDIKQVEFNTIAASFGALSQRAGEMHRYVRSATPI